MPYRIAIGSCSHPSLPQPLWPVLRSRRPSAFVWGGDAIYADRFAGLNWTAVGVSWIPHDDDDDDENEDTTTSEKKGSWKVTFPPPSIHVDATPEILREWYRRQWEEVDSYREFVGGWERREGGNEGTVGVADRPVVFGTIDDHDYGSNNGDASFRFRRESNLEFLEFLYFGSDENRSREEDGIHSSAGGNGGVCITEERKTNENPDAMDRSCNNQEGSANQRDNHSHQSGHRRRGRDKFKDPMYQRALEGKGVYGVQLFDFSRKFDKSPDGNSIYDEGILWGGGYWVPEDEALVDDDVVARVQARRDNGSSAMPNYSTTHSVAVFVLDVRSNKTPWPTKGSQHRTNHPPPQSSAPPIRPPPPQDFLGEHQWKWLRSSLRRSRAPLNILLSGLQVHPHRFPNDGNIVEEWSKFPAAQELLYDVLLNSLDDPDEDMEDEETKGPPKRRGGVLLVSGDVHMAQFLRKDCVRARHVREALENDESIHPSSRPPILRPLVEVTTSGMTHSWGTSFSSQPKLHRWPRKPYAYFVSRTFMTLCHYVNPWREVMVRTAEDVQREKMERRRDERRPGYDGGYDPEDGATAATVASPRGKMGLQYELGLNFAEFEFEFWDGRERNDNDGNDVGGNNHGSGGAVTVRIFGKEGAHSPKLQSRWTFDQLSGDAPLPGRTAKFPEDFASMLSQNNASSNDEEWICVPHRGNASVVREYVANVIMFFIFCFLFFLPHLLMGYLFVLVRRRYRNKRSSC